MRAMAERLLESEWVQVRPEIADQMYEEADPQDIADHTPDGMDEYRAWEREQDKADADR